MIKAIAVDDEPLALEVVEVFCARSGFVALEKTFTQPGEALKYLKKYPVDLIFLDVKMPAMSGIDFYNAVGRNVMVIFTTGYGEYAVEGFNLDAIDFLLKPFEYGRFEKAVNKAREHYQFLLDKDTDTSKHLILRVDYSLRKIDVADILYIEGLDNYVKIYMEHAKPLIVRMSMKAIEEKLSAKAFLRVHRSFIIPVEKVDSLRNKILYIKDVTVPVGKNYVAQVEEVFGT